MGKQLFSNNASTLLASGITDAALTLTVTATEGAKFQSPQGTDYELITISSGGDVEVCKVTGRAGDVLTIIRDHEGVNQAWGIGAVVEGRATALTLASLQDDFVKDLIVSRWSVPTVPASLQWAGIAWSPSLALYAVVAASGTLNRAMTSPDGETWIQRTTPSPDEDFISVVWAESITKFVAVSNSATTNVMVSADGVTWTYNTGASNNNWEDVTWAASLPLLCAISSDGVSTRVQTSADAVTWTTRTNSVDNAWQSVVWAPELDTAGLFVAVSNTGTLDRCMTSPDGVTWTTRTTPVDDDWKSVAWSPELHLLVAVAGSGAGGRVMSSPDGITWTARTGASTVAWWGVEWIADIGYFVAVANSGNPSQDRLMVSKDGINWEKKSAPGNSFLNNLAWSPKNKRIVAIGDGGGAMISL